MLSHYANWLPQNQYLQCWLKSTGHRLFHLCLNSIKLTSSLRWVVDSFRYPWGYGCGCYVGNNMAPSWHSGRYCPRRRQCNWHVNGRFVGYQWSLNSYSLSDTLSQYRRNKNILTHTRVCKSNATIYTMPHKIQSNLSMGDLAVKFDFWASWKHFPPFPPNNVDFSFS